MSKNVAVAVGDQVFTERSPEAFGAVRQVSAHELIVNVENFGDIRIAASAVRSVHDGKVVVHESGLPDDVRTAIGRAHSAETQ